MISIYDVTLLLWLHFLADFVLQTDQMALNKSHSIKWLSIHGMVYTLPFLVFGWRFALLNGVLHWLIDFVTSRINAKLWKANQRHWFFTMIGFDQALHITCLFVILQVS